MLRSADVFCRVIDNLGDAGVAWRLVRQLAREHGLQVRLVIDQPVVLQAFVTQDAQDQALLASGQVQLLAWPSGLSGSVSSSGASGAPSASGLSGLSLTGAADLVIETFGCDVPDGYAEALVGRVPAARWYNLEYLSAEDWVQGCHALPSPHSRLPLTRVFFFPGFVTGTGGLLREAGLLADVATAQRASASAAVAKPVANPVGEPLVISLFCYAHAGVHVLLDALEQASARRPVLCRVFQGPAQELAQQWALAHPGHGLQFHWLPWLGQAGFDQVLWQADFNLVRGEDSFVRAQWAGRPLLWDIYPQEGGAHLIKLEAFLRCYGKETGLATIDGRVFAAWADLSRYWVRRDFPLFRALLQEVLDQLPVVSKYAGLWQQQQGHRPDLVSALLEHSAHQSG